MTVPLVFSENVLGQVALATLRLLALALPVWVAVRFMRRRSDVADLEALPSRHSPAREAIAFIAVVYGCLVVALTLYPLPRVALAGATGPAINLVPLYSLVLCARDIPVNSINAVWFCVTTLVGNVALFFPFGVLLPWLSPERSVESVTRLAMLTSVAIEIVQLFERQLGLIRTTDVDDVLLNTAGAFIGALIFRALARRPTSPEPARAPAR